VLKLFLCLVSINPGRGVQALGLTIPRVSALPEGPAKGAAAIPGLIGTSSCFALGISVRHRYPAHSTTGGLRLGTQGIARYAATLGEPSVLCASDFPLSVRPESSKPSAVLLERHRLEHEIGRVSTHDVLCFKNLASPARL